MQTFLTFHGEMRWIVVFVAVVLVLRSIFGWTRGPRFAKGDRILMTVFVISLDVNLLLGLTLLLWLPGGFTGPRLEHALTMLLAVVVAHSWAAWRRSDDAVRKFRNNAFVALAVIVLVVIGVLRLRGTWLF